VPESSPIAEGSAVTPTSHRLWDLVDELRGHRFVDLTQAFRPGIPHSPDFTDEVRTVINDFARDGFRSHRFDLVGQWGTHVDAPIHCAPGGRTVDEIAVAEMIAPLVVFDMSERVAADPDFVLSAAEIRTWEDRHGPIPPRAFAALRTGWSRRWPDPEATANEDATGVRHTPGWSVEALRFLCEARDIVACGHDTGDTDPGVLVTGGKCPAETWFLATGRYQIEFMTRLEEVPPTGAIIVASFPKPASASGFPARVFAIVPH
jgi:kynurenine formamidase